MSRNQVGDTNLPTPSRRHQNVRGCNLIQWHKAIFYSSNILLFYLSNILQSNILLQDNVSSYEWIFGENFISPGIYLHVCIFVSIYR